MLIFIVKEVRDVLSSSNIVKDMKRRSILGRRNRNPQDSKSPALGTATVEATPKRNEARPLSSLESNFNVNPFETPRNQVPLSFNNPSENWSVFKLVKNWNTPQALINGGANRVSAELAALGKEWCNEQKASNCNTSLSTSALNGSIFGKSPLENTLVDAHSTPFSHSDLSNRVDSNQDSSFKPSSHVEKSIPSARRSLAVQNNLESSASRFTFNRACHGVNSCPTPLHIIREDKHNEGDSDVENRSPYQDDEDGETTLQCALDRTPQAHFDSDKLNQLLKEQCDIYSRMKENEKKMAEVDEERLSLEARMEEIKQRKFTLEEECLDLKHKMDNQLKLVCSVVENAPPLSYPQSGSKKSRSPARSASAKKRRPSVAVMKLPKQNLKPSKALLSHTPKRTAAPLSKLAYTPRSLRKSVNDQLSFLCGE
ncbi:Hypothetical protein NTJ_00300 [Nesidiocoris tenuis]|uniref:cGMP-dependent protein kinase N-terminal coiled-coil domain-containing protein n=1 Tax=Nesidiocoris tenuis TaxID=355587 RepID=A0ABN7A9F7_9HEMI|nr:Hypothetical protein NTJ_00300 [Nesidiocoris tenuis]